MKRAILEALEAKYQADIAHADATLKIYLESIILLNKEEYSYSMGADQDQIFNFIKSNNH